MPRSNSEAPLPEVRRSSSSKKKKAPPKRKRSGAKRKPRPYKLDKASRARHRYRKRRHKHSRVTGHHKRALDEAHITNYLLNALLKTASSTDQKPYHYHPRHHTNDPEYGFSGPRVRTFKRGFPSPDVNLLRSQGDAVPPHRGNFPDWRPT